MGLDRQFMVSSFLLQKERILFGEIKFKDDDEKQKKKDEDEEEHEKRCAKIDGCEQWMTNEE